MTSTAPPDRARRPAVLAGVFGLLFLVLYAVLLIVQGDAGWGWLLYATPVAVACALTITAARTGRMGLALVAGVLFALCLLLGLLSIGILLLPATVLAFLAFGFSRRDRALRNR